MAPRLPPQSPNDPNGLNPSPSHRSHENQFLWSSEVASWVNFQPLTSQHPQHGHEGQLEQEQLTTPQIPFQPRSIQNTYHDQRWLEEEEILQMFRDDHDHESQARFEVRDTHFRRDVAQLSQPFGQIQDHRNEQLNVNQELRGPREMLAQLEKQMEQGGLRQERDGTIPSLPTGFVHQRFQGLQNPQSPYDGHNLNTASSQVYFQKQPDQHGRQSTYQDTQHGDQDRRRNEGQPLQMGPSHVEGHKRKGQPSDHGVALPQRENDRSHLPPTCGDPPLAWSHLENKGPYFDSLSEQMAYSHPDQQVQQSSRVAAPVPWSLYGMDFDTVSPWNLLSQQTAYGQPNHQGYQSMHTNQPQEAAYAQRPTWYSTSPDDQSGRDSYSPSLWQFLPQQVANGRQDHEEQQSTYGCQTEQAAYGQQPIRDSTPPRIQSRAAIPIPSNPPGMDLESMTPWKLRLWNNTLNLPSDRNRDQMIKQAKTGKAVQAVKKSKRPQKKRNLKSLYAGYAQAFVSLKNLFCSSACHTRA